METTYRFRTAVGGFHKGDVSEYIAKTAASHRSEIAELENRISELEEQNRQLLAAISEQTPEEQPLSEPENTTFEPVSELELQAYRRAEAAERLANQRAKKLYQQLEAIAANTRDGYTQTHGIVAQAAEDILAQTRTIQAGFDELKSLLNATQEELSSLDAMLPDPLETLEEP